MAQFKFRWQVLLSLRERERDQRRQDLALACSVEREQTQRRDAIAAQQAKYQAQRRQELAAGHVSIDALRRGAQFESHLREQWILAERTVAEAVAHADGCRQSLSEAEQQVRVLEKLRERRRAEFQAAAARSETRTLDEVGGRISAREAC